ncbi:MAG: ATP-binding cassette domain-containing protein [Acidobacteria bacterium]|jgi:ABC-2 type transport system ATP-binding protein|nr:ATP-binding cassette domain-containing protein [Acidobacteriota bacterium]
MSELALSLQDLVKDFDGKRAVDGISFSVRKGEILGLLGPNGAGKTTTMRMVMDIIAPDAGRVEILGEKFSEAVKDRIGYLPEERGLYRKLKVMDTLLFFGELKGMKAALVRERGRALLQQFQLQGYEEKKVEELSKGMAQKLQFIVTILHDPELLILDEPFSGLDPLNIELVKDIILERKRQGRTIIYSTHLMEYAEKTVDALVMIDNGRKVIDGTLAAVKAEYGHKFIRVQYEGDARFVKDLPYVRSWRDSGREMEVELDDLSRREQLLRDLLGRVAVNGFALSEPSLQNIFIRKVQKGAGA